jgi:tRNA1Val (adenine37-N6)-methyltransferase
VEVTQDSIKDITLFQPKRGYRFSVDALLLEDFIKVEHVYNGVELGAGSGVISILLAKRLKKTKIIAVEIQKSLAECARKNVEVNRLDDRIEILVEDIRNLKRLLPANKFDFVFSNPPFRKVRSGRLSVDEERAIARHEIKITLNDIVSIASFLLKNTGKFYIIYHPFRLIELINLLQQVRLEPKRMRFVHSRAGQEAKMVLIEAVKGSGTWLKIEPPFYIYENNDKYSAEMRRIYGN